MTETAPELHGTLNRLPFTKAVRRLLADVSGMPVGKGRVPTIGSGEERELAKPPFYIAYPLWVTLSGPPMGGQRHADAAWNYQFACVSEDADQIEWMRDKVVEAFLGKTATGDYLHPIDVPGISVMERDLTDDASFGGTDSRVGSMSSDVRFVFRVTPIRGETA